MAKIPIYTQQGQYQSGRRAYGSDFGGGEGIGTIAQEMSKMGELSLQIFEKEMESNVFKAVANSTTELNDLLAAVEEQSDHHLRKGMYEEGVKKIADNAREGLRYGAYKNQFTELFFNEEESGRVAVSNSVRQSQLAAIRANDIIYIEKNMDSMTNAPDQITRKRFRDNAKVRLQQSVDNGTLRADQAAAEQIKLDDRYDATDLLATAQALTDEIWARESLTGDGGPLTIEEKRSEARSIGDPRLRVLVENKLDHLHVQDSEQRQQAESMINQGMRKAIRDGMTIPQLDEKFIESQSTRNPMRQGPYNTYLTLIGERDGKLTESQKKEVQERNARTAQRVNDYFQLYADPSTRYIFNDLDLVQALPEIDPKDSRLATLQRLQRESAAGIPKEWDDAIGRSLAYMGLPFNNATMSAADKTEKGDALLFRKRALDVLKQHRTAEGSLSESNVQELLDDLTDPIMIQKGMLWGGYTIPLFKFNPEEIPDPWGPEEGFDPSEEDRKEIIEKFGLANKGALPSEEQIIEMFVDDVLRRQGRPRK